MRTLFACAVLAVMASACTHVTSGIGGGGNGEGWYTKQTVVLGFIHVGPDKVFYCPKDTPTKCTRAEMR